MHVSAHPERGLDELAVAHGEAVAALRCADAASALACANRAAEALNRVADVDPIDAVNVALTRARALRLADRDIEALAAAREAYDDCAALPQDATGVRLRVQGALEVADQLRVAGCYDEARPLLDEALARAVTELGDDDDTASAWNSLGIWHRYTGGHDDAVAAYTRSLDITRRLHGGGTADEAAVLHNLASVHHTAGNAAAAEAPAREAVRINTAVHGPDHPAVAADLGVLGAVLADLGRYDEAAECYATTRRVMTAAYGPASTELAYLACNEAALAHLRGDPGAGEAYASAQEACERAFGLDHPQTAVVLLNRAALASDNGKPEEARELATRCEVALADKVPFDHPHRVAARRLFADV